MALREMPDPLHVAAAVECGSRRTRLVLHVAGEDKGLLCSKHYADNGPFFPPAQAATDLTLALARLAFPPAWERATRA